MRSPGRYSLGRVATKKSMVSPVQMPTLMVPMRMVFHSQPALSQHQGQLCLPLSMSRRPAAGKLNIWLDLNQNVFDHATEHLNGGVPWTLAKGVNRINFTIPEPDTGRRYLYAIP
ncbi:MAG: hypothetical protein U0936_06735 [Planctomycetaceae bacterium]